MYNYLSIPFSFLCIFLYFCLLGGYFEYNSERILIVFFYKSKKLLVKKKAVRDLTAGIAVGWLLVVGCFMISDLYFTDFCFLISVFCFLLSALCFLLSTYCFLLCFLRSALCFLLSAYCSLLSASNRLICFHRIESDQIHTNRFIMHIILLHIF